MTAALRGMATTPSVVVRELPQSGTVEFWWGDGTHEDVPIVAGQVSASHEFPRAPYTYMVWVTVWDSDDRYFGAGRALVTTQPDGP